MPAGVVGKGPIRGFLGGQRRNLPSDCDRACRIADCKYRCCSYTPATRIRPSRRSASAAPRDHVEQCDRVGRSLQAAAPCYRRRGSLLSGTREGSRLRSPSTISDRDSFAHRDPQDARRRAAFADPERAQPRPGQQYKRASRRARTRQALGISAIMGQGTGHGSESCLSSDSATFDSGLKKSNATSRNAPAKPLDFRSAVLYARINDRRGDSCAQGKTGLDSDGLGRGYRSNLEHRSPMGVRRDGDLRIGRQTPPKNRR